MTKLQPNESYEFEIPSGKLIITVDNNETSAGVSIEFKDNDEPSDISTTRPRVVIEKPIENGNPKQLQAKIWHRPESKNHSLKVAFGDYITAHKIK